jgi:hypothetical protein
MLMRIPDHLGDSGQRSNLFGRALGVAPGDNDVAAGILAVDAADAGASVPVGGGSYGTGIQNDDLGMLGSGGPLQAAIGKLALYSGAVGLRRSTAKILYVKARHSNIVA